MPRIDLPGENWNPVVGYESYYLVSNLGRVWSFRQNKIMKPRCNPYPRIALWKGRKFSELASIHHLVMAAFIGPKHQGIQVNHRNGIKTDNRLCNLEYVTPKQNARHSIDILRNSVQRGKLVPDQVREARALHAKGETAKFLAEKFGLHRTTMKQLLRGEIWKNVT